MKNFCKWGLIILSIVATLVTSAYLYYHFCVDKITIGTYYVDDQVGLDIEELIYSGNLTEEEISEYEDRYFLEVNYYSNKNNNGIEVQELKLNYFTDYTLTSSAYRSTGMQYVGNYSGTPLDTWDGVSEISFGGGDRYYGTSEESVSIANSYVDPSFYYYDSVGGISFNGITNSNGSIATELKRSTQFIIKIDNNAYSVQLDKYYDQDVGDVRNIFGIGWKIGEKYNRYYYTYGSLFQSCMQAVATNSQGYGDYYIVVSLGELFSFREYDMETGKFTSRDVTDIFNSYCVLKFHYDENGLLNANQSLFGQIYNDKTYGISEDINVEYWQTKVDYLLECDTKYLNKNVFDFRYSSVYDGYFISMSMDAKELFANTEKIRIFIDIDLQSDYLIANNINIIGIDYNGFENCLIDTLTIIGESQTFYMLDYCLNNTKLKTLEYSDGIVFDFSPTAINNIYSGVIL